MFVGPVPAQIFVGAVPEQIMWGLSLNGYAGDVLVDSRLGGEPRGHAAHRFRHDSVGRGDSVGRDDSVGRGRGDSEGRGDVGRDQEDAEGDDMESRHDAEGAACGVLRTLGAEESRCAGSGDSRERKTDWARTFGGL